MSRPESRTRDTVSDLHPLNVERLHWSRITCPSWFLPFSFVSPTCLSHPPSSQFILPIIHRPQSSPHMHLLIVFPLPFVRLSLILFSCRAGPFCCLLPSSPLLVLAVASTSSAFCVLANSRTRPRFVKTFHHLYLRTHM